MVVAGAVLLTACSAAPSGSAPSQIEPTNAQQSGSTGQDVAPMCALALGAGNVVSAGPLTTVGELRAMKQGPGFEPARDAFPGVAASAPAGFCWTKGNGDLYLSFGVTSDGQKVHLAGIAGTGSVPSGPPVIP